MSEAAFESATAVVQGAKNARLTAMLADALFKLDVGVLIFELPTGRRVEIRGAAAGPVGVVVVHRWRALRRLLLEGDIGFAKGYMDGDWTSPNLSELIENVARNQASVTGANGGALLSRIANRLIHLSRANTLAGSRRNIVRHYDLGNAFYAHWLDDGMSYSSALFRSSDSTLEAGQIAKQDRVLDLLELQPSQSVLEIGIGWGGMAERVVRAGGRLTGVTLSPAQLAYAQDRFAGVGLPADLSLQDYRHVEGRYDRIVSIEMLEAVGEARWPAYFCKLREVLAEKGRIVLQTITIADDRYAQYRSSVDFIQRYIFPGGMLPAPGLLHREIERAGLVVESVETFGESYARTLRLWRERFDAAWPNIAAMGFSTHFKRMWQYYLSYCEGGFRAGSVDVGLWLLRHRS